MRKCFFLIFLCVFLLCACGKNADTVILHPEESFIPVVAETSFSDGFDAFIDCYNRNCMSYGNENILKRGSSWSEKSDYLRYHQYDNNWLEPDIRIFADESGIIKEIRISYEDHGYTTWGEALSNERMFYTLRSLDSNPADSEISELIMSITEDMKNNIHYYDIDSVPEVISPILYGQYLIYHYFSSGAYFLCIIPA